MCDRSFWRFNRSFLPPLCFSVSSLSIFLAPYPRFKRASRAAGPSPWSSLPSGPPGCDLDARRSGLTLLLFCLEGFIDGPCLKASAPILVALRCLYQPTVENQGQAFSTLAALPGGQKWISAAFTPQPLAHRRKTNCSTRVSRKNGN